MGSTFNGADVAAGGDPYAGVEPDADPVTVESLVFAPGQTFGEGLKAGREFLGLDLQSVADATKIRSHYLAALEAMDLAQLPSRPFILGYVRAYARVLGVDDEQAIARFRQDAPDPDEPLRAPVGVPKTADPRFGLLGAAAGVVIAAIVVWNVAQRAMAEHDPNPSKGAVATVADPAGGPVQIGEALPPPQESTLPDPYITPGLAAEVTGVETAPVDVGPLRPPLEARTFIAKGTIHGAPATQSQIVIQAQRSVSLVARGGDGKVYFAQQLKGGEAYRAPMLPGLLIDVSSPEAMEVFVGGALVGTLTEPVTPLSAITRAAPPPPLPAPAPVATPARAAPVTTQQATPSAAPAAAPAPRPAATRPAPRPARQPRTYARVPAEPTPQASSPAAAAPSALAPAG
jgi:cytoskeletal protein RodZ